MATITQNITIDVARANVFNAIIGKQFDTDSRFLKCTLAEEGEAMEIESGVTVAINARRPDNTTASFAGARNADGTVTVPIDEWILEQNGMVSLSVSIVGSSGEKLTSCTFYLNVQQAEGEGWLWVYTATDVVAAGTYHINFGGVNYQFTLPTALESGDKIYFSSALDYAKSVEAIGAEIDTVILTVGSGGTALVSSELINFLASLESELASYNSRVETVEDALDTKADKSGEFDDLTAGTAEAVIDPTSYTANTSPYLYRQSPSGKRCEMDIIGGTVGWNQYCNEYPTTTVQGITLTNDGNGKLTASGTSLAGNNHFFMYYTLNRPIYKNHKYCVTIGDLSADNSAAVNFRNRTTNTNYANVSIASSHPQYVICNATDDGIMYYYLNFPNANTTITGTIYPMVIDLTALLGSTIADYAYTLESNTSGSGIAWLRSFGFLTKSYYPYSEPTLESVEATARQAVGINQWDEEWENGGFYGSTGNKYSDSNRIRSANTFPVIAGATYYFKSPQNGSCFGYASDGTYLGAGTLTKNSTFTIPTGWVNMAFSIGNSSTPQTTYNNDICINISNSSINGTYYPYESHTYPLDSSLTLRGVPTLDAENNLVYKGDEYQSDGTIKRKAVKVTLDGSENWAVTGNGDTRYFLLKLGDYGSIVGYTAIGDIYQYASITSSTTTVGFGVANSSARNQAQIAVRPADVSDMTADEFKALLAANPFTVIYVLTDDYATTETADPFTPIQYTGSTEAFTTSNDVPVGVDAKYYTDLTLPKLPTANGTYSLKCTVTDGVGVVSWEA